MAKKKVFQISNALTEGLEETVSAAHNYTGELRIEAISLKKVELDPENPRDLLLSFEDILEGFDNSDPNYLRKKEEVESLESMVHSINEQGIINPILVYKFGDKYRLIAGERRTLGSLLAGKAEIQARIVDSKPSHLKISLLQWVENVERKDLSLAERLVNLHKILRSHAEAQHDVSRAMSATELSGLLGCSIPQAMNYLAVLNADQQLSDLIQENKIKNLEKAALISSISTDKVKQAAIDACLLGATLKKLKSISNQEKQKKLSLVPLLAKGRGRQASAIQFGSTKKVDVAKLIFDSVLENDSLESLKAQFSDVNWTDFKSVNQAFKQLLRTLERVELERE